jgi:hypothetical protein
MALITASLLNLFSLQNQSPRKTLNEDFTQCKIKKIRGPQPTSELYQLNDCHLSAKFSANFCG